MNCDGCGEFTETVHYGYCDRCWEEIAAGEDELRRMEENEAAAIVDSWHRYGWCYE